MYCLCDACVIDEAAGAAGGETKCLLGVRPTGHESVRVRRMTVGAFSQVEESEQTGSAAARACGSFKRHGPINCATPDANEDADAFVVASTRTNNPIAAMSKCAAAADEQHCTVEVEAEAEAAAEAAAASSPTSKLSTYGGAEAAGGAAGAAPERTAEARTSVVSIPCVSISITSEAQAQAQAQAHEEALAAERKGSVPSSECESAGAGASDRRVIVGRLNTAVLPRVRKLSSSGLENPFFRQTPAAAAAAATASASASSSASVVSSFIAAAAASANESLMRLEATCTLPKSTCAHTALVPTGQKDRLSAISREAELAADAQRRHSFGIGAHAGEPKADKKRAGLSLASAAVAEPGGYPSAPPPTPTLKTIVALATSGRSERSDSKEKGKGKTGTD